MFEKEAKKRAKDFTDNEGRQVAYECGFLDGADRATEELKEKLAGLKAGRPKWHKVADGDLPKENKLYLVAIKDNGLAIAYFNGRYWETKYNLGDFGYCVETVIAWCEIPEVPNNLKESK